MGTGITLESGGALKVINNVVKIVASNTTTFANLRRMGSTSRSGCILNTHRTTGILSVLIQA
jgi:hypothetical protein